MQIMMCLTLKSCHIILMLLENLCTIATCLHMWRPAIYPSGFTAKTWLSCMIYNLMDMIVYHIYLAWVSVSSFEQYMVRYSYIVTMFYLSRGIALRPLILFGREQSCDSSIRICCYVTIPFHTLLLRYCENVLEKL